MEETFTQEIDRWVGQLTLAIGRGEFRKEIAVLLMNVKTESFTRGLDAGKLAMKSELVKDKLRGK